MIRRWAPFALLLAAACHPQRAEDAQRGLRAGEPLCGEMGSPSPDDDRAEPDMNMGDPAPAHGADFRGQAPGPGSERPFVIPRIEEARLANGIRVLIAERHELPIVAVHVGVDRGAADAPPGLGGFLGAMLHKGTPCLGVVGINAIERALGAKLGTSADYDATIVALKVLTPGLDAGLSLVEDTLQASFADEQIDKERAARLSAIAQRGERHATLLEDALVGVVYPGGHPYALPVLGTASAIKKVTRDDLLALRDARLRPERITIAVAGDVRTADLRRALETRFGAWRPAAAPPLAARPLDVTTAGAPRTIVLDDRGATQSTIALSCVGAPRGAPDVAAIKVLARVLSWAFDKNLRQKHGYTYGVTARFVLRRGAGPFIAGGAVAREHTADAVREMLAEIEKLRAEPPSPATLRNAQRQLVNEIGATFETAHGTADALLHLAIHGLPLDEHTTLPARLRAVTGEDVKRAAQRYLDPGRMHLVIVGDEPAIRNDLASLGRGAHEVRTIARSRGTGADTSDD